MQRVMHESTFRPSDFGLLNKQAIAKCLHNFSLTQIPESYANIKQNIQLFLRMTCCRVTPLRGGVAESTTLVQASNNSSITAAYLQTDYATMKTKRHYENSELMFRCWCGPKSWCFLPLHHSGELFDKRSSLGTTRCSALHRPACILNLLVKLDFTR